MRTKRFLLGTAAFICAAVLLTMQLHCRANENSSRHAAQDTSLLKNSCVIGHSHAVGMQMVWDVDEVNYIAEVGLTALGMLVQDDFSLPGGGTGGLRAGLSSRIYDKFYILLGTNDVLGCENHLPVFKSHMEELLILIEEYQPKAEICLLSIAPFGEGFFRYCEINYGLTQDIMNEYNEALRDLASDYSIDYLDISTVLSNDEGFLSADYDRGDGLHFNEDGYQAILRTMLTYLEEKEDASERSILSSGLSGTGTRVAG
ncbi:MAG: hypothetical protein E7442_00435 [Ruminococcaceae bacterium]|nr:hypothetical protein [Oscillospiraceae bacterium]